MRRLEQFSLGLCCAALATVAAAQEPPAPSESAAEVYVPAEPLKRSPPAYPAAALASGREGWAKVSFVISDEGEVIEPMIEDSSNQDFDAPTLRAIEKWRYKPAMLHGTPVEQSMVQTIILYKIRDSRGASAEFVKKYRAIQSSIVAKNFAEAADSLKALEEGAVNYYEDAWLWWLKYVYLEAMGGAEPDALMEALRKSLGSTQTEDDNYLEPDIFVSASQRLYVLSVRGNDFADAISVLERLRASKSAKRSKLYKDVVAALDPSYQQIMSAIAGPAVLRENARIGEHSYWVHRLLRRSFSFGDVKDGKLEIVDLRCTRANRRLVSVPEGAVLKIPDTWGDCSVYIKGDEGATFAFEEYSDGLANAVDPAQMASKTE